MKPIRCGIDFDSILFDSTRAYLDLFNEYTGEKYTVNDITEWEITNILPKKYNKLVRDLWLNPELWERTYPLENSQMYTKLLSMNNDIELFVITDTDPKILNTKVKMLNREYPWLDTRNNLFVCKRKQMVNVDVLIDDGLHNTGGNYQDIVLDYPWNRSIDDELNNIIRVKSWEEIYHTVLTIKSKASK